MIYLFLGLMAFQSDPQSKPVPPTTSARLPGEVGPFVRSLWLFQSLGTAQAALPQNDQRLKGTLAKAIAKDSVITLNEIGGFMTPDIFNKLAGEDGKMNAKEIAKALEATIPESRKKLVSKAKEHADFLTTGFDQIDEVHRKAGEKLAQWIATNYSPGKPLEITVVCTGNSRRSMMGSSMGNLAAAYYGMPEIRFHSGGTSPTAFNSRTITALKAIGFQIEKTAKEAERGEPKTANPVYHVSWGQGLEMEEFSKHYANPANPQTGFAALMVCSEADEGCPIVKGASLRIPMPYLDPKSFDDSPYESAKYAERRDDIGRLMLSVMLQARQAIAEKQWSLK